MSGRWAIDRLDADLAEVVGLVHWERMTLVAVGMSWGIAASTARGRYQRAREQLCEALSKTAPTG